MHVQLEGYGLGGKVSLGFAEAVEKTKEALQAEGFGVLCEIDIQATLKAKLGVDRHPYKILGACNPKLANQALDHEQDLGLLLPCNVVVYETPEGVWVKAIEPGKMLSVVENPDLDPVATQVREMLTKVLERLPG